MSHWLIWYFRLQGPFVHSGNDLMLYCTENMGSSLLIYLITLQLCLCTISLCAQARQSFRSRSRCVPVFLLLRQRRQWLFVYILPLFSRPNPCTVLLSLFIYISWISWCHWLLLLKQLEQLVQCYLTEVTFICIPPLVVLVHDGWIGCLFRQRWCWYFTHKYMVALAWVILMIKLIILPRA